MNWSSLIRQIHRWTSAIFAGAVVIVTIAVVRGDEPAEWVYLMPLLPLAFLGLTGAYLFVLPYARRWRGRRTGQ